MRLVEIICACYKNLTTEKNVTKVCKKIDEPKYLHKSV